MMIGTSGRMAFALGSDTEFSSNTKTPQGTVHRRYVRLVHPGIRHNEPKSVFNDQHAAARPYDTNQLR